MKDLGIWSVQHAVRDGEAFTYFMYRGHYMGRYFGSVENAQYMVVCINAALAAWSAIDDAVKAESGEGETA